MTKVIVDQKLFSASRQKADISTNPDDYLVVDNKDDPATWHMPVSRDGKPDHRLMGNAWAALFKNFRGNAYAGPGKEQAKKKLKALYASEGLPTPTE